MGYEQDMDNYTAAYADQYRFCPLCDVSLDLHDGPDTCRTAGIKADLLDQFWVFTR